MASQAKKVKAEAKNARINNLDDKVPKKEAQE